MDLDGLKYIQITYEMNQQNIVNRKIIAAIKECQWIMVTLSDGPEQKWSTQEEACSKLMWQGDAKYDTWINKRKAQMYVHLTIGMNLVLFMWMLFSLFSKLMRSIFNMCK